MARTEGSHTTKRARVDARDLAWTAIRIHKRFTSANIASTTGVRRDNLKHYLKALRLAGYIRIERPTQSGKSMGHAVWRLTRDTGPKHPLPRRDQSGVWDQNQQILYPYAEEEAKHGQQQAT